MAHVNQSDVLKYRRDVADRGRNLSAAEREKLIQPYLPEPIYKPHSATDTSIPSSSNSGHGGRQQKSRPSNGSHRPRVRPFLKSKLHFLTFFLIQLVFGIYIRMRQIYHAMIDRLLAIRHYHHRTPEYIQRDVKNLDRLPEHLSVILKFKSDQDGGLEALMDEVGELCAWSASAGIPLLSIYEKSGILKAHMPAVQELATLKLRSYFGPAPAAPSLRVFAPNHPSMMTPSHSPASSPRIPPASPALNGSNGSGSTHSATKRPKFDLLILSASDGRDTLVDLTRTLAEMAQARKISPKDITPNLINTEISATTSLAESQLQGGHGFANGNLSPTLSKNKQVDAGEPDLVIIFGPFVKLDGYPPWQVRLSEIFCVGDSGGDVSGSASTRVEYQGFLRGLWRYAGAEMRFGR